MISEPPPLLRMSHPYGFIKERDDVKITCSARPPPSRYKLRRSKVSQMEKYTFLHPTIYTAVVLISLSSSGQALLDGKLEWRVHFTKRHQKQQRSVRLFTWMGKRCPQSERSQYHYGTDCELWVFELRIQINCNQKRFWINLYNCLSNYSSYKYTNPKNIVFFSQTVVDDIECNTSSPLNVSFGEDVVISCIAKASQHLQYKWMQVRQWNIKRLKLNI